MSLIRRLSVVLIGLLLILGYAQAECDEKEEEVFPSRYPIAYFKWEEVKIPMTICLWLIAASISKIGESGGSSSGSQKPRWPSFILRRPGCFQGGLACFTGIRKHPGIFLGGLDDFHDILGV